LSILTGLVRALFRRNGHCKFRAVKV
jgi:hypothetical protein